MEIKKLFNKGLAPLEMSRRSTSFLTGFTLVEIMIVIAIIATLATISIPIFVTSRINANETSAVTSCKTIFTACQAYYMNIDPKSYPSDLGDLVSPASNPPYLDTVLAVSKRKQGYSFSYVFEDTENFTVSADPVTPGRTGNRYFFVDETGIIRAKTGGRASAEDAPVE